MNALMLFMLTVTCTAAAGLEIRCMMKKSIPDNSLSLAGRRIKVAGYTFLTIRFVDLWLSGGMIYAPSAIALPSRQRLLPPIAVERKRKREIMQAASNGKRVRLRSR